MPEPIIDRPFLENFADVSESAAETFSRASKCECRCLASIVAEALALTLAKLAELTRQILTLDQPGETPLPDGLGQEFSRMNEIAASLYSAMANIAGPTDAELANSYLDVAVHYKIMADFPEHLHHQPKRKPN
jgi:hypothetical protein